MKFANVDGQRQTAQPGSRGTCPECDRTVIARCGEVRVHHWAHEVRSNCNSRWESEGPWHQAWKNQFPPEWQEVVHLASDGERHIADVKTGDGWVLEFQHSFIKPEERRSRDAAYSDLVWVVDALRRKRDLPQLESAWNRGRPVRGNQLLRRVEPDGCTLLREWGGSPGPVFFDIGEGKNLVWLLPKKAGVGMYMTLVAREMFVGVHRGTASDAATDFHKFVKEFADLAQQFEALLRTQAAYGRTAFSSLPVQRLRQRRRYPL